MAAKREQKLWKTASFAPLNNLLCERNFGTLDGGWRRQSSSSFHHLTSLIMLKENRSQLTNFCRRMSISQRKVMWAKAVIPKARKTAQTNGKTKRRPKKTL